MSAVRGLGVGRSVPREAHRGFTLIEMLVVIGIIAILIGASLGGYSAMTKTAEKAKAQELVSNAATALTALFQREGSWPKRLISNNNKQLDEKAALALARGGYFSLTKSGSGENMKLVGHDRFGIVTPWATAIIKKRGTSAQLSDQVTGTTKVKDHILYYALDLSGKGVINAQVGGEQVKIRATAAVWSIGKSGGDNGQPWTYSKGRHRDDVYSWSYGQTQDVD